MIKFSGIRFLLLLTILLFSSKSLAWEITDDLNAHEPINAAAVSKFYVTRKNLDFEAKYLGVAWHSGSATKIVKNCSGIDRSETFEEWVKIGGVDADIDSSHSETKFGVKLEKPLRHFYDPVASTLSYLTDFHSSIDVPNPKMDHITWALTEQTHQWSFHQGLLLYKAAMENKSADELPDKISNFKGYFTLERKIRENLFAASFRALGETLHCVADLCMPAHVRDDSHAGHILLGGKDFVELTIGYDEATKILNKSNVPSSVSFLDQNKSVRELLENCARFTNSHFFSNDTICNEDPAVIPTTYNKKNYNSPSFNDTDFEILPEEDKNLDENLKRIFLPYGKVLLAVRQLRTSKTRIGNKTSYVVPPKAAVDQASVLLPLAAAAGGEIIDRFLPTMKLSLDTSKDENSTIILNGSLLHEIDKDIEWKSIGAIKYCGEGEIMVNNSTVATATFVDGIMNPVKGMSFKENDKVQLVVKAGALIHNSNTITIEKLVAAPAITLTCLKSFDFIQLLQKVTVENSRKVGYIGTPKPEIMATVLGEGNNIIAYNWWCEDAAGTWVSDYYAPYTRSVFPYEDMPIFGQDGGTPKDLKPKQVSNTAYFCAPAGNHTLHIRAYYGSGAYQGLLESPSDKSSRNYVQKDVTFTVAAATSPIIRYKNDIPWEEISFKDTTFEENFTGPAWAPNDWKRLKFQYDGPYTYYPDYKNQPEIKVTGNYTNGIRSGNWEIKENSYQYKFAYDSEGNITWVNYYDGSGNLKTKYTAYNMVNPSFSAINGDMSANVRIITAHVETFSDPKEEYNLVNEIKEGAYSFSSADGKTINGQYSNGSPSGIWTYHDPSKTPSDWTVPH